jgi:hypothetical protein
VKIHLGLVAFGRQPFLFYGKKEFIPALDFDFLTDWKHLLFKRMQRFRSAVRTCFLQRVF